jgi:hypothetical protein
LQYIVEVLVGTDAAVATTTATANYSGCFETTILSHCNMAPCNILDRGRHGTNDQRCSTIFTTCRTFTRYSGMVFASNGLFCSLGFVRFHSQAVPSLD